MHDIKWEEHPLLEIVKNRDFDELIKISITLLMSKVYDGDYEAFKQIAILENADYEYARHASDAHSVFIDDADDGYDTIIKHFIKIAEEGYVNYQWRLGGMYKNGYGVYVDYDKALYWFSKAAAQADTLTPEEKEKLKAEFYNGPTSKYHNPYLIEFAQESKAELEAKMKKRSPGSKYSKAEIIEKVHEALKNPSTLYTQKFVNYTGIIDGQRYTEIIARELALNKDKLENIPMIKRKSSYKTKDHDKRAQGTKPDDSKRDEEWIAKGMYGKTYDVIGKIIDFQIPLKDTVNDKAGKIDLLSYNEKDNTVYILELKRKNSPETFLRCVLEAYTYWKMVDGEKLLKDYGIIGEEEKLVESYLPGLKEFCKHKTVTKGGIEKLVPEYGARETRLKKAVLLFQSDNCLAYKDSHDNKCCNAIMLKRDLGVNLFVLTADGNEIIDDWLLYADTESWHGDYYGGCFF